MHYHIALVKTLNNTTSMNEKTLSHGSFGRCSKSSMIACGKIENITARSLNDIIFHDGPGERIDTAGWTAPGVQPAGSIRSPGPA